jgi:hypothetical protein
MAFGDFVVEPFEGGAVEFGIVTVSLLTVVTETKSS